MKLLLCCGLSYCYFCFFFFFVACLGQLCLFQTTCCFQIFLVTIIVIVDVVLVVSVAFLGCCLLNAGHDFAFVSEIHLSISIKQLELNCRLCVIRVRQRQRAIRGQQSIQTDVPFLSVCQSINQSINESIKLQAVAFTYLLKR